MKQPTVIEGVGLYGSGKTTSLDLLSKSLRDLGYKVLDNSDFLNQQPSRLRRWSSYFLSKDVWYFMFLRHVRRWQRSKDSISNPEPSIRDFLGPAKQYIDRKRFVEKNSDVDFIIFDEASINNIIHFSWKYYLIDSDMKYFLRRSFAAYKRQIVYFATNLEASVLRTSTRNQDTYIDNKDEAFRRKFIAIVATKIDTVYAYLKESSIDFITVDPVISISERNEDLLKHFTN